MRWSISTRVVMAGWAIWNRPSPGASTCVAKVASTLITSVSPASRRATSPVSFARFIASAMM